MREARTLRIVVASPSDVQAERDLLPGIIDELNRGIAADRGLRLELSRWETDAYRKLSHYSWSEERGNVAFDEMFSVKQS